jgi:hypothetical protein
MFYTRRYLPALLLEALNINLLATTVSTMDLKQQLENVFLTVISKDPTNFSAAKPTLLDICASSEVSAMKMFSQISLLEMFSSCSQTTTEFNLHRKNYLWYSRFFSDLYQVFSLFLSLHI